MTDRFHDQPEPGDRIRHAYKDRRGKTGTVARVETQQFLVAFDDGQRVWFEISDLGSESGFSLKPVVSPHPVKVCNRDPLGALARLRAYFLDITDAQAGMPDDPHELVEFAIASHAAFRWRAGVEND